MSALGQKQTFAVHQPMSALPPRADMAIGLAVPESVLLRADGLIE